MPNLSDAAKSRGDVMSRLAELERQVRSLQTSRRLEAASIGRGGLRVQGGRILAEDASGERVFEVTTEPPGIFMRPELISTIAAQAFADRITADSITGGGTGAPDAPDWGDLPGDPGPSVTADVTDAGRMIVMLSAQITLQNNEGGRVSFEISDEGGIVVSPFVTRDLAFTFNNDNGSFLAGAGVSYLIENLDAGLHTVTMKYQDSGVDFRERSLIVIAF